MKIAMTLVVAAGALGLAAVAGAEQRYTDATGDNNTAPDLTQVEISNTTTHVSFAIVAPSRLPENEAHLVLIDTDASSSTGDDGNEARIFMMFPGVTVETWNGSSWVDAPSTGMSGRFELSFASTSYWRVSLPRSVLSDSTAFDFVVISAKMVGEAVESVDVAPDRGSWHYELALKQCANGRDDDGDGKVDSSDLGCSGPDDDLESDDPYTLSIGRPSVTPGTARGGRPVVVRARVLRVETKQPLQSGSVRCLTRIGSKTVRSPGRLTAGTATCRLTAPKVARPSTVRGTVTVTSKTATVSAPFSFRTR
jgi:hypothetical protein